MAIERNTLIGGKYRLERRLGEGSMGEVWQALHEGLGTSAAVKLLRSDRTQLSDIEARFEREATTTARLRSQHVVTVHDYGVDRGHAYLAMELLEGDDLDARIQRDGPVDPASAVRIISQTARGLQHAHDQGIIHRDLKPENVFLAREDGREVAKILDFGIAKVLAPDPTKRAPAGTAMGILLGSPNYMSPEHIEGRWDHVDHRSDLWSLGVIAFHVLTGRLPFEADGLPELTAAVTEMAPYPACGFRPELPAQIDAFFAKTFAKDMSYRFDNALEMAEALALALGVPYVPSDEPATGRAGSDPPPPATPSASGPPRSPTARAPLPRPQPDATPSLAQLESTTAMPAEELAQLLAADAEDDAPTEQDPIVEEPTLSPEPEAEGERTVMFGDNPATALWQVPPPPPEAAAPAAAPPPRPAAPTLPSGGATRLAGLPPRLVVALVAVGVAVLTVVGIAIAVLAS